jgi:nucleoside-diphosphate-sugar epimerase
MKIIVIGGTGLIGSKVVANLKQKGHEAPRTGFQRSGAACSPVIFVCYGVRSTARQESI